MNHKEYDQLFLTYAKKYDLSFAYLKAQVKAESNFNPNAVSKAGAKGLPQFMPATWKEWGNGRDILDPQWNLDAQARYMKWTQNILGTNKIRMEMDCIVKTLVK